MASLGEQLRGAQRAAQREQTVEQAVAAAFAAGERGLELFMATSGLSRAEALRELQRRRQRGRAPSACIDALLR